MILNHLETVLLQKGLSVSGEWNVSPANGRWDLVEERLISEGAASVWGALFEEIQEPFFSFPCRRPEPGKYLFVTARDVLPGLLCVTTGIRRHFQYTVSSSFFFPGRENRKRWKENSGSAALPVLDGAAALSSAFRERERRKSARAGGAFPAQGFAGGRCLSLRL